ncbi:MAG: sulfite exporter TauE/SafE family protein [Pseudomonadota bacterium]
MSFPRKIFEFMEAANIAYGKWDYEVSMNILEKRKKLLILMGLAAVASILAAVVVDASDILGSKTAYAPAYYATNIFLLSILIGFCAGLITGCIGAGGGFIITPALMAAGVKGILAVGTDLFHIFAKAIMGSVLHGRLGNVSVKLAIAFLVGSIGGSTLGGYLQKVVYAKDPILSDAFLSIIYALILGLLSWYGVSDFLKKRKQFRIPLEARPPTPAEVKLAFKLQSLNIPPMVRFDEDMVPGGKKISGVILAAGGFLVGLTASLMGVGGGFITFPMFVYVFGISTFTTVGTDIFQIVFTAGYAGIVQYAIYGFVFYTLAMGMLLGSLFGIQIGALTTKVVKGVTIRGFWVTTILAGFINRVSALPKQFNEIGIIHLPKSLVNAIGMAGNYIFWIIIGAFVLWVLSAFVRNIKTFRGE